MKILKWRTFVIAAALAMAIPLLSQEPPKMESLNDLVAEALQKNPALAAARARWEAAKLKTPQAVAWDDPMLMFGGTVFAPKGNDPVNEGDVSYGVAQTIPFPGKRRAAATVAEKDAARVYEEYVVATQEIAMELRKTHAELLFNQKMREVNRELRNWMETAEKAAAAKVAANQALLSEVTQMQVELAMLDNELAKLHDERGDFVSTMNRLLGRPSGRDLVVGDLPDEVDAPTAEEELAMHATATFQRPAIRAFGREMERAQAAMELARKERTPDFTLSAELKHYHGDGDLREAMFSLSVPFPWANNRKYRAAIATEKENFKSAKAEQDDLKNKTWEELHHRFSKLRVALRTVKTYEDTILPRLVACCISDLAAYEVGQLDFLRVLNSYREWKKAELIRYEALATALKAQADINAMVGAHLPLTESVKKGESK